MMNKIEPPQPATKLFHLLSGRYEKRRQLKLIVIVSEPEQEKKGDEKKETDFGHINDWKHVKINDLRRMK